MRVFIKRGIKMSWPAANEKVRTSYSYPETRFTVQGLTFRCRLITLTSSPMTAKKKSGLSTKNAILAGRDIEENI
jgi:hypothetical protein